MPWNWAKRNIVRPVTKTVATSVKTIGRVATAPAETVYNYGASAYGRVTGQHDMARRTAARGGRVVGRLLEDVERGADVLEYTPLAPLAKPVKHGARAGRALVRGRPRDAVPHLVDTARTVPGVPERLPRLPQLPSSVPGIPRPPVGTSSGELARVSQIASQSLGRATSGLPVGELARASQTVSPQAASNLIMRQIARGR